MSEITTREFVIGDFDRALALWKEMGEIEICEGDSREEIGTYLERNPGLSCVAEVGGKMIGAVLCGHDGRRGWIYHLAVAAAHRGRGIGKLLIEECCRGLREAGLRRAIILVERGNSGGREFWVRNGWEDIANAIPMGKDL
jgi:ribosomal protein S18 acetylase RimI-like enzyme